MTARRRDIRLKVHCVVACSFGQLALGQFEALHPRSVWVRLQLFFLTDPDHALQNIFGHLALGQSEAVHPGSFWRAYRDYDGSPINVREHQDAQEFFTRLQVRSQGSAFALSSLKQRHSLKAIKSATA